MICFEDKTFCNKEMCKKYRKCKESFYQAKKRQEKCNVIANRLLPFCVCDLSSHCKDYEPWTLG